jgi:hypothetical protein
MNVDIGTEAAQFPEKEYIIGIFLAVQVYTELLPHTLWTFIPPLNLYLFLSNFVSHPLPPISTCISLSIFSGKKTTWNKSQKLHFLYSSSINKSDFASAAEKSFITAKQGTNRALDPSGCK